jgi:tRNA G18 (ribose-2'-O)-methylase SpoU
MPVVHITSADDPQVQIYRDLKHQNTLPRGKLFIVEGVKCVERLLESRFGCHSVLISDHKTATFSLPVPSDVPLYVIPQDMGETLIGFNFHRGVLAAGFRPARTPLSDITPAGTTPFIVVCPRCDNPENLGAIIRLCSGFGVTALVLGNQCCDPFSRRVIRVSMGTCFKLPIVESRDLRADLIAFKDRTNARLVATVLSESAIPLDKLAPTKSQAVLFGNEDSGLEPEWIELCDVQATIPMAAGVDSLNLAVAAGIFMHWLAPRG